MNKTAKFVKISNISEQITLLYSFLLSGRMTVGAIQFLYLLNTGVSLAQIAILKSIYAFFMILFDIPSSYCSKFISYKICVIIGCLFLIGYYLFSLLSPSIFFLVIAEICYSASLSFFSGNIDAWQLAAIKNDYPNDTQKINYYSHLRYELMVKGSFIFSALGVISVLIFSNLKSAYVIAVIFSIVVTFAASKLNPLVLKDEKNKQWSIDWKLLTNKRFVIYTCMVCTITLLYQPILHYWQPLFVISLGDLNYFGINSREIKKYVLTLLGIFFAYNIGIYIMNYITRKNLLEKISSRTLAIYTSLILIFSLTTLPFFSNKNIIFLLFSFVICHGALSLLSSISGSEFSKQANHTDIALQISFANVFARVISSLFLLTVGCILNYSNFLKLFYSCIPLAVLSLIISIYGYTNKNLIERNV